MTVVTVLFTLSLLSSAAVAETYCYYNAFNDIVCRERLSAAARIAIAVASFAVVFAILLAYAMHRRRRVARANMAFVNAPHNQQQGYPNQYPPPPQEGFFGVPFGGNGQKEQQAYGQQQYNGQYSPQYNAPQYPPAAYDQGSPNHPVPPYPGFAPPPGPPPQHQGNPHNM